jgi:hypothetical protein
MRELFSAASEFSRTAWFLALMIIAGAAAALFVLTQTRAGTLLHENVTSRRRRRLFVATVSFFSTFALVRELTYSIHLNIGPFGDVQLGGRHIHHLVWGILILLVVGYGWLLDVGDGQSRVSRSMSRLTSILFGIGAALTLDEYALWLNLRDVYWAHEGRASVDAIVLFGTLLLSGFWGAPFLKALGRELASVVKRKTRH